MTRESASTLDSRLKHKWLRLRLQARLVAVLLVLSLVPLTVTAVLVGNLGEVAQNFARNHVAELRPHLAKAQDSYRQLIAAKKREYEETSRRLAATKVVRDIALQALASAQQNAALLALVHEHGKLLRLEVHNRAEQVVASKEKRATAAPDMSKHQELMVRQAIGVGGAQLVATFAAELAPAQDLQALAEALAVSKRVETLESSLPRSYRLAFLLLIGAVVLTVLTIAIVFARRMSRRINLLVDGARAVAKGDLEARVDLGGNDELVELASAFNSMVADLRKERQKILYLQRIGAWQDVARKLAHEIKNPLTPIQLVVQQAVSSYKGDDPRYRKLLDTCEEIVQEEIDSLRRLVDAFRDLGRLPKVEAASLAVATVVDDLVGDPAISGLLQLNAPHEALTVSADRLLLRRTLVNLVENGIHAGQERGKEGKVLLSWRALGALAEFRIEDEGDGVPADKQDEIFDPYVTTKETGTGLGLAIAKKVALDHGGNLRLEQEAGSLGGALFVLEIPLCET